VKENALPLPPRETARVGHGLRLSRVSLGSRSLCGSTVEGLPHLPEHMFGGSYSAMLGTIVVGCLRRVVPFPKGVRLRACPCELSTHSPPLLYGTWSRPLSWGNVSSARREVYPLIRPAGQRSGGNYKNSTSRKQGEQELTRCLRRLREH